MKSIFESENYRDFVKERFKLLPNSGYGQSRKLAEHLRIHTTLVSQVLSGTKSFTAEQAALTAEFLSLTSIESEYFVVMVLLDRAGNKSLRDLFGKRLEGLREQSKELVNRLTASKRIKESDRAQFYSDWIFSAIRQMTAIPGYRTVEKISASLRLPQRRVSESIEFLLKAGLCVQNNGQVKVGPKSTHLESTSKWVRSHHRNWRLQALQRLESDSATDLHYTAPMTLSAADASRIREALSKLLENIDTIVEPSSSEELHCLNIDWFKVNA